MLDKLKTPMSIMGLPRSARDGSGAGGQEQAPWWRRPSALLLVAVGVLLLMFSTSYGNLGFVQDISMQHPGASMRAQQAPHESAPGRIFRAEKKIVVLLTNTEDSEACARTILSALDLAAVPARISFRVAEEFHIARDDSCSKALCDLRPHECQQLLRSQRVRVVRRDASGALGPSVLKHLVESFVVKDDAFKDHFYLSTDSRAIFTKRWDVALMKQWYLAGNERAILSIAPPASEWIDMSHPPTLIQCSARIHSNDPDAVIEFNPPEPLVSSEEIFSPVLQSQYSERFHFGRVSSLLAVRSDPHLHYLDVGVEYMRATRFWTHGIDFYAPMEAILFYRYETPLRPQEKGRIDDASKRSSRRVRRLLGLPVSFEAGEPVEERALYAVGANRTMHQWHMFGGVDPAVPFNDSTVNQFSVCLQKLHYVPLFSHPE